MPVCQLDAPRLTNHHPLKFSSDDQPTIRPTPSTSSYLSHRVRRSGGGENFLSTIIIPPYRASQHSPGPAKSGISQPSPIKSEATRGAASCRQYQFIREKIAAFVGGPECQHARAPSPRNANHNDDKGGPEETQESGRGEERSGRASGSARNSFT